MTVPDTSVVQALLQLNGLTARLGDAERLADLLNDHLKAVECLFDIDTSDIEPAATFDPSWD